MPQSHPPKDQLMAFGQGKLAADESLQLEQHLEVCPECCETLLDLKDDTFTGLVRASKVARGDLPPGVADARDCVGTDATEPDAEGADRAAGADLIVAATLGVPASDTRVVENLPIALAEHSRYRIVDLIGRGGMGSVYRAEHRLMNRTVAIKLVNSELVRNSQAVERFRREVQAAAKLSHPNIVTAYDAEQAGDAHFLVMEYVSGVNLATVVAERGPLSVTEACRCAQQAAEGLEHAHQHGMVHRDIKPHNLMISVAGSLRGESAHQEEGRSGSERATVRILDFGLAGFATELALGADHSVTSDPRATSQGVENRLNEAAAHLTAIGSVMGTPDYIAPEQAADAHSADIRADIYSLGCTLHFLLTGKPPFEAGDVVTKLMAHVEQPPPDLRALRADVPAQLAAIVQRMLAKNPADRFQTPSEVAAALAPFTRPTDALPRKRMRNMLAAAAAILLTGVIYITTDKGRIEIRTEVDDVDVVVAQGGKEVKTIDLETGSQVTWMPSGDYTISLRQNRNDVRIDNDGFRLTRWGKQIVTVRREKPSDGATAALDQAVRGLRDHAEVTAYLNDPNNNLGGSVPVALLGREGRVAFRFGNWLVVFEGIGCDPKATILGFSNFNIPQPGSSGEGTVDFGAGDKLPGVLIKFKFANETNEISINNNRFKLKGKAARLEFDDKAYDAKNSVQTILVARDGSTRLDIADTAQGLPGKVVDQLLLQGLWIAVSGHEGKQAIPAEQLPKFSITIDQDQITIAPAGNPSQVKRGTFKVIATSTPKRIDIVVADRKEPMAGIYEVDQKRLKLAIVDESAARPTDFSPSDRPDHLTAVFERAPITGMSESVAFKPAGLNGGFEVTQFGLPVNWSFYTSRTVPNGDFDIVMDKTDFKEGEQSLKFVVRQCESTGGRLSPGFFNEFHASLTPPGLFETKPGETYKISFWAKNAGSEFVFKARGVSPAAGDKGTIIRSKETFNEWRRFECTHTIPLKPKMLLRLELNVVQPGTFWIDDLQIVKVDDKAAVPDEQRLQGK